MVLSADAVPRLGGWDLAALEARNATIYALRPDLTVAYRNAHWDDFAVDNGGADLVDWSATRSVLDVFA